MDENQTPEENNEEQQAPEVPVAAEEPAETESVQPEPAKPEDDQKKPSFFSKINPKVAVLAGVALLLVVGLVFMMASGSDDDTASNPENVNQVEQLVQLSAAIGLAEGTVEHSLDGETWQAAEPASTVKAGERVRTLADSRAVLILDDGSAVRLDESTQVMLFNSDAYATDIALLDGQVYSRVVESDERVYAVFTDRERFEAQGTAYTTSTDEEKDEIKVFQSDVKVDSEDLTIDEGNKYDSETKKKESIDIDELENDEFVSWNKEQDEKDEKFKDKLGVLDYKKDDEESTEEPVPEPEPNASIGLSGSTGDKGVNLSWELSGASASDGFKVVYDKSSSTPTYKTHSSQYVGSDARSTVVNVDDGNSYYFRVCIYRPSSGSCDTYSNSVKVTAPVVEIEPVQAGAVTLSINDDTISWSFAGTAPHGFKVVMNSGGGPTYPSHSIKYVGPETTSAELPDKPAGTYYVKVCKYTADSDINGGCTDYSNQVEYVVD